MVEDFRLKVFVSVARNLSFSKAAHEVFISQPAVSKHIRELESIYSTRLFERNGSKISLTQSGKLLLVYAERILAEYNQLNHEMNLLNDKMVGALRIGASSSIAQYYLPAQLASFSKKYPLVQFSVVSGNTTKIEKLLIENQIDIGIIEGLSRQHSLRYTYYHSDELVFILKKGNKIASKRNLTLDDLVSLPFVIRETGSGTLEFFEKILQQADKKLSDLNIHCVLDSTEGIIQLVKNSTIIGLVPKIALKSNDLKELDLLSIDGEDMNRDFMFVTKFGELDQLTRKIFDFLIIH